MRALLSVYDKTGIVEFATALHEFGCDLVSSGGTAKAIAEAGVPVTDIADLTGVPAILGHRVVTLHPKIHGGILADPDDPSHRADMEQYGIEPIDLVVVNAYPFSSEQSTELIDIGGPTMIRAAAKNRARVGVVTSPTQYDRVLDDLRRHGALTDATRRAWRAMRSLSRRHMTQPSFAGSMAMNPCRQRSTSRLEQVQPLRYGENPHQRGARYREIGTKSWWDDVVQHSGMELSYLNLYDASAAWELAHDLGDQHRLQLAPEVRERPLDRRAGRAVRILEPVLAGAVVRRIDHRIDGVDVLRDAPRDLADAEVARRSEAEDVGRRRARRAASAAWRRSGRTRRSPSRAASTSCSGRRSTRRRRRSGSGRSRTGSRRSPPARRPRRVETL